MSQTNLTSLNKFKVGDRVYLNWEKMEIKAPNRNIPWDKWCFFQRNATIIGDMYRGGYMVLVNNRERLIPKEGVELPKYMVVQEIIKDL